MHRRVCALFVLAALLPPVYARADQTSAGVQLAGTHGTHREADGTVTAPLIPAPLITVSHSTGCFETAAEGLPPLGPISVGNNGLGMQNVELTYADAVARYWNPSHTVAVGIGDTLYNQRTNFVRQFRPSMRGSELDTSRVVGTRYELTIRKQLKTSDAAEARIAVNPALHGRFSYTQSAQYGAFNDSYASPPSWERASQVDADAHFVHRFGPYAIAYGIRYLNYTAQYTDPFHPQFADANALVMPYVAFQRFWGEDRAPRCTSPARFATTQIFFGGEGFTQSHTDVHATLGGSTAAAPMVGLRVRRKQYEAFFESVSPGAPATEIRRFSLSPQYTTNMGYADVTARYWLRGGRTAVGIGDSIYVSQTRLLNDHVAIRAAGTRYELVQAIPLLQKSLLIVDLATSPKMHKRETSWLDDEGRWGSPPLYGRASLFDTSARLEMPQGAGHFWTYGARYVHYTALMPLAGTLSERTGVLGFFAAWGFSITP